MDANQIVRFFATSPFPKKKIKSLDVEKNDPVSSFKQNQLNKSLSTSEKKLQDFQF